MHAGDHTTRAAVKAADGRPMIKSIKHPRFNEARVMERGKRSAAGGFARIMPADRFRYRTAPLKTTRAYRVSAGSPLSVTIRMT